MNRFKKELRKRGIKLECDYEYLPYNGIETVVVNSENATVSTYHLSAGWCKVRFNKAFTQEKVREAVLFFSEAQIKNYFDPLLGDELADKCKKIIERWCKDYKAILHGSGEYTEEELCNLLIDPWNPVRNLPYLGF